MNFPHPVFERKRKISGIRFRGGCTAAQAQPPVPSCEFPPQNPGETKNGRGGQQMAGGQFFPGRRSSPFPKESWPNPNPNRLRGGGEGGVLGRRRTDPPFPRVADPGQTSWAQHGDRGRAQHRAAGGGVKLGPRGRGHTSFIGFIDNIRVVNLFVLIGTPPPKPNMNIHHCPTHNNTRGWGR